MPGPITVNDLVDQVRDQLDESNQDDVTQSDILQALNRAQRRAANILVKKNEDFFIAPTTVTTTATDTYDLPEDSFGRRLDQVLVVRDQREYPLKRVSYRELWKYTSSASVSQPYVYATRGREYTVKPTPQAGAGLSRSMPLALISLYRLMRSEPSSTSSTRRRARSRCHCKSLLLIRRRRS
jgi:hypothetical protein